MDAGGKDQHPVLAAASAGQLDKLQAELSKLSVEGSTHGVKDAGGRNALHLASRAGHFELIKHLLETDNLGFEVESADAQGNTPLAHAVDSSDLASVKFLISKGANVHATPSLTRIAASKGDITILNTLLAAGVSPDSDGDPVKMPPIFLAAAISALKSKLPGRESEAAAAQQCVDALLASGANPDATAPGGFTPLHVGAEAGSEAMIDGLLAAGANAAVKNEQGDTPADVAAMWGHKDLVGKLLTAAKDTRSVEEVVQEAAKKEAATAAKTAAAKVPAPEEPDEAKAEELKQQGNAAFKLEDYSKAYDLYRSALKHWTQSAALWSNSAATLIKLGRNEEALRYARVARTVDPKFIKAWYREGVAAEALERWEDAAAAYFEAAQIDPNGPLVDECERHTVRCVRKGQAQTKREKEAAAAEAGAKSG